MPLIICSREDESQALAHGLMMCTEEEAHYLMHFGIPGQKKGQRRYQDESGRLTPEGYRHYAEMYGWNKRLAKAEKLQNKADRDAEKSRNAKLKYDRAVVKNSHKSTAKSEGRVAESKRNADEAQARANLSQDKASRYADKLERKEDREAKYRNEDGTLNEKGLEKYTYATDKPGERKMNLLGKLKFGTDYANKFDTDNKTKLDDEVAQKIRKSDQEAQEWQESYENAAEDYESVMKSGNDSQKEEFLKEAWQGGQTSPQFEVLVVSMQEKSGDLMSGYSQTEANSQAVKEWNTAEAEYKAIKERLSDQAKREYPMNYSKRMERQSKLFENNTEYKAAREKINTTFERYCATVLKDMGLPVNENTMQYIESIIVWN